MKILIVGFGSIAKKHYHALLQIEPSVTVIALRSNSAAEPIKNVISIHNSKEIKQYAPFDFVIISNPSYKHAETMELMLDLSCPLFIEKPLFNSLQSAQILNKVSAAGNSTYVACNLRFLDSLNYLKNILLPRILINEVNVYCGSFLPEWRKEIDYKLSYSAHQELGGGVHLDLIHELDYVYWLFGKPMQVLSYKSSKSTIGINAIDYANFLLEYDKFAVNVILNYYRKDLKRTMELVCSDDTYIVDLSSNTVTSTKNILFESDQTIADTYKMQLEYFIGRVTNSAKKKEKMMNDVYEAFEVLKICLQ